MKKYLFATMFMIGCSVGQQSPATCPTLLNNFHSENVFVIAQKSFDELKRCICYEKERAKYCPSICDEIGSISDECYWKVLKGSCEEQYYSCMFSK